MNILHTEELQEILSVKGTCCSNSYLLSRKKAHIQTHTCFISAFSFEDWRVQIRKNIFSENVMCYCCDWHLQTPFFSTLSITLERFFVCLLFFLNTDFQNWIHWLRTFRFQQIYSLITYYVLTKVPSEKICATHHQQNKSINIRFTVYISSLKIIIFTHKMPGEHAIHDFFIFNVAPVLLQCLFPHSAGQSSPNFWSTQIPFLS